MPGQGGAPTYASGNPQFGNFINDPTAQMGFQVGKTALNAGQEYVEQNVCGLLPNLSLNSRLTVPT